MTYPTTRAEKEKLSVEARVLASLAEPATAAQLVERLVASRGRLSKALKGLMQQKKIFISGWGSRSSPSARLPAIYSLGQGETPPYPRLFGDERVMACLPATSSEIQKKLGIGQCRVSEIISRLAESVCVIGFVKSEKGDKSAIYGLRVGDCDAPEPAVRRRPSERPTRYEYVRVMPKPGAPLYRTPWQQLPLTRFSARTAA